MSEITRFALACGFAGGVVGALAFALLGKLYIELRWRWWKRYRPIRVGEIVNGVFVPAYPDYPFGKTPKARAKKVST